MIKLFNKGVNVTKTEFFVLYSPDLNPLPFELRSLMDSRHIDTV